MSLALVRFSASDFQLIHNHLTSHKPGYRNMHLRKSCARNGHRALRFLHAMHANSSTEVEGMISGPNIFCHYKLISIGGRTQINVLTEQCLPAEKRRFQRYFLSDILRRIREERAMTGNVRPRYARGQYYLHRQRTGMPASHSFCRAAVSNGALHQSFVAQLQPWQLALLYR